VWGDDERKEETEGQWQGSDGKDRQEGKKETRKIIGKGQGGKEKRRSRQERKKKRGGTMKGRKKQKQTNQGVVARNDRQEDKIHCRAESRREQTRKEITRMKN
jgi:hypothetical protein